MNFNMSRRRIHSCKMLLRRVHFTQMKMLLSEGKPMPTEDEMTLDERRKYLKRMKLRYMKAKREERSVLLSEMEQVTGMHRKSLTRRLACPELGTQETPVPALPKLWQGGRRGNRVSVGKSGLYLRRTA